MFFTPTPKGEVRSDLNRKASKSFKALISFDMDYEAKLYESTKIY
jgi:hypothetical protein